MNASAIFAVLGLVGLFVLVLTGHVPGEAFIGYIAGGAVAAPSALASGRK